MELGLSLGETQKQYRKSQETVDSTYSLGFCMGLSSNSFIGSSTTEDEKIINTRLIIDDEKQIRESCSDPLLQLHLLPFSPLHKPSRLPLNQQVTCEPGNGTEKQTVGAEEDGGTGSSSSPNSTIISSFRMEYGNYCRNKSNKNRDKFEENNRQVETAGRGGISDDDEEEEEENGLLARKKLRLTKDQSAFLEESFKQHNTLNPKQKLGLAKQLNLRPRQVEVWFQNRRARTKLKQTEVDCEYLKRCCETLTEENRRLQKELLELRTLKSSQPSYMQLPATTLAMCPSCERTTTASAPTAAAKPILHTFLQDQGHALQPV